MKYLTLLLAAPLTLGATAQKPTAMPSQPTVDRAVLQVQVILDKLGFSPGVLDGKRGQSLTWAIKGFQQSRGLAQTGQLDRATMARLRVFERWQPVRQVQLDASVLSGPFTPVIPTDNVAKGTLPGLHYRNALESLAERYHTTPATLIGLNSRETQLRAGTTINVPNALPISRDYAVEDAAVRGLLGSLNVNGGAPEVKRIVVDKSDGVLRAYDARDRLVMVAPATMGSKLDPLPLGNWKVTAVQFSPPWKYNPAILKKADKSDPVTEIKPGPNSPVGVVWIDLSKEHYGIHGTADPEKIGRAESNGCVRLTNWDAARLATMVRVGVEAKFQA